MNMVHQSIKSKTDGPQKCLHYLENSTPSKQVHVLDNEVLKIIGAA